MKKTFTTADIAELNINETSCTIFDLVFGCTSSHSNNGHGNGHGGCGNNNQDDSTDTDTDVRS